MFFSFEHKLAFSVLIRCTMILLHALITNITFSPNINGHLRAVLRTRHQTGPQTYNLYLLLGLLMNDTRHMSIQAKVILIAVAGGKTALTHPIPISIFAVQCLEKGIIHNIKTQQLWM